MIAAILDMSLILFILACGVRLVYRTLMAAFELRAIRHDRQP